MQQPFTSAALTFAYFNKKKRTKKVSSNIATQMQPLSTLCITIELEVTNS